MAPKKTCAKSNDLPKPPVTPTQLAKAKQALSDAEAKKRANSNMHCWLDRKGWKKKFHKLTPEEKREFFLCWFADSLEKGEVNAKGHKTVGLMRTKKEIGQWWSKKRLYDTYGAVKAENKMAKLPKRADRDTGLDDDENAEWYVIEHTDENAEVDNNLRHLEVATTPEDRNQANEDMMAAAENLTDRPCLSYCGEMIYHHMIIIIRPIHDHHHDTLIMISSYDLLTTIITISSS